MELKCNNPSEQDIITEKIIKHFLDLEYDKEYCKYDEQLIYSKFKKRKVMIFKWYGMNPFGSRFVIFLGHNLESTELDVCSNYLYEKYNSLLVNKFKKRKERHQLRKERHQLRISKNLFN